MKLTDILNSKTKKRIKESNQNMQPGRVYSNPYATAFVKESDDEGRDDNEEVPEMKLSTEQRQEFLEAVSKFNEYKETVFRTKGLSETFESIKNLVEVAGKLTLSETDEWFDNVTVSRHMKRMNDSFKVFEKTIKEVGTLQQRLESSYDEIGEVLNKYYKINDKSNGELQEGNVNESLKFKVGDFISKRVNNGGGIVSGTEGYIIAKHPSLGYQLADKWGGYDERRYNPEKGFKRNASKSKNVTKLPKVMALIKKKQSVTSIGLGEQNIKTESKMKLSDLLKEIKINEGTYEEFFKSALKKFNVTSPDELEGDKKAEFFNYIDKNWDAGDNETDIDESVNEGKVETWVLFGGHRRKPNIIEKFPNEFSAVLAHKKNFGKESNFDVYGIKPLAAFKRDYPQVTVDESMNEGKFQKDDVVYNRRHNTVGIVRLGNDKHGDVKTDADGNVYANELELYNPTKNPKHKSGKMAPSTKKEIEKRGLKAESVNESPDKEYNIRKLKNLPFSDAKNGITPIAILRKIKSIGKDTISLKDMQKVLSPDQFDIIKKELKVDESVKLMDLKESTSKGHYEFVGNQTLVDSNFVNLVKGMLPDSELVHMGMGDFALKTPTGNIEFRRTSKSDGIGPDFVGRPHRVIDNTNQFPNLLKKMQSSKKVVLSMSESVNEGKKRFYTMDNIGSTKYSVNYHDGKSTHKDGSDFFGIQTFQNKRKYNAFKQELVKRGYTETNGYTKESMGESKIKEGTFWRKSKLSDSYEIMLDAELKRTFKGHWSVEGYDLLVNGKKVLTINSDKDGVTDIITKLKKLGFKSKQNESTKL